MSVAMSIKSDKEKFWQEQISSWEQSGLSQGSYCEKQGISFYAFVYWRTRFNRRLKLSEQKHFEEVSITEMHHKRSQPMIQIVLPNGVRIGIGQDASTQVIREASERSIKPFVIGRKNWLFHGNHIGAHAGSIFFSLIETCKYHKVEAFSWLKYVLTHIHQAQTTEYSCTEIIGKNANFTSLQ